MPGNQGTTPNIAPHFPTFDYQQPARSKNTRPTIGLLTSSISFDYLPLGLQGVIDTTRKRDVNLLCFVGGLLRSPQAFDSQSNILYDLIDAERVNGLIVWTGALDWYVSREEILDFCKGFHPLPIVSIETALAGIPSLLPDNYQSMREAIAHLIEVHGYRRIACIRGPAGHLGLQERYRAYIDTLAEYGLPFDPNLVCPYSETWDGAGMVKVLLDERKLRPPLDVEAIVALSDGLALRALEELQIRGIQVPDVLALIGYDDIEESKSISPSLTTVQSLVYEQGRQAVETLLNVLAGKNVPEQVVVPAQLMVRESCGCMPKAVHQATINEWPKEDAVNQTWSEAIAARREHILTALREAIQVPVEELERQWAEQLLDDFVDNLNGQTPNGFLHALGPMLRQTIEIGSEVETWHQVISVLRHHTLPCLMDELKILVEAESLWQQARILIGEYMPRKRVSQVLERQQWSNVLYEIRQSLNTTVDVEQLVDILVRDLPRLDIPSFYLALYEDAQRPVEWSNLILAYNRYGRIQLASEKQKFRSSQLVPEDLLPQDRPYSLVIEPLYFQESQLGLALFEVGKKHKGGTYAMLRGQISSSMKGALLVQKHEQAEMVLARQAQELARSNTELEQFAYIASHDLQEPLRMVKSYLQLLERRYKDKLDANANDFITFAVDGAARMGMLINDLLKYSQVGTQAKPFAPTACALVLQGVLDNLKVATSESEAIITCDDLPTVMADEVQLAQLFQNLLGNALKFRQPDVRPEIHVGVARKSGEWLFSVRDNGIGIAPQNFKRLFMIFKRLHGREEYPGTGIGLAICKKIVEHHGGRIWVESDGVPGQGTTFYFTLPDREM
jgi:signal transduction histidine kinase/DNA-binding LacI/PurR family transcriptional regulator